MNITRETIKSELRGIMAEETDYQTFFKKALEKAGKSIPSMSDEEKKEFFNKIDAAWNAKGEKNEGNAFGAAVTAAKEKGEDEFEVGGKTYKVESVNEISIPQLAKLDAQHLDRHVGGKSEREVKAFVDRVYKFYPKDVRKYMSDAFIDYQKNNRTLKYLTTALRVMHQDIRESVNESAGCGCGCGCGGSKMNEEFKSKDNTFEKVYGIFDKKDYFNAKGLAKTQIGNFERALQRNDKGAQQILDKFNGDMNKAKEYIIQVISDQKKAQAFEDYKALKAAVDSIQKGKPIYGAVDLVKSRAHNNTQKYTMALYSALRGKKFNNYKDIHADVDSLIGESVNEARLKKVSMLRDVEKGQTSRVEGVKISPELAFELRMFLERPMLARTRTGIAIDNAQMKDAIGMLAKVGVHKRLSSGVKKEFAELLKKYK